MPIASPAPLRYFFAITISFSLRHAGALADAAVDASFAITICLFSLHLLPFVAADYATLLLIHYCRHYCHYAHFRCLKDIALITLFADYAAFIAFFPCHYAILHLPDY